MPRAVRPHVAAARTERKSKKPKAPKPSRLRRQERISTLLFAIPKHVKQPRKKMSRTISDYASSPSIPVLVGLEEKAFYIHISLLNKSPFFRTALQKDRFKEGEEQAIRLPEDEVLPFKCFFEWIYQGEHADTGLVFANAIEHKKHAPACGTPSHPDNLNGTRPSKKRKAAIPIYDYDLQFKCYVLGDKLQVADFKDHVLQEISQDLSTNDRGLRVALVRYVYENTMENDPLRKICTTKLISGRRVFDLLRDGTIEEVFSDASPCDLKADFDEELKMRMDMEEEQQAADEDKRERDAKDEKLRLYEDMRAQGHLIRTNAWGCCVEHRAAAHSSPLPPAVEDNW